MQEDTLTYVELREAIHHLQTRAHALLCCKQWLPTHYIWRTQRDGRVRETHAMREGRMFEVNRSPRPGEDYNCRCWAEPVGAERYAEQLLLTVVKDNPDKWTDVDFFLHYVGRSGKDVTLSETGYLAAIINYYSTQMPASDGTIGVYRAIEKQILDEAEKSGPGPLVYNFSRNYDFQHTVSFTLGDSTISGIFAGEVRKEENFLVISGMVAYHFSDAFRDPESRVEKLVAQGIERAEAERRVGNSGDWAGVPYDITDDWKTKFNGTIRIV